MRALTLAMDNHMPQPPIDESTKQKLAYHYHRLSIYNEDSYLMLPLYHILFIQANSNYSTVYLANGKQILTCKTLKVWEDEINHPYFYRCHRSYFVNTKHINRIHLTGNTLEIEEWKIPISRHRRSMTFMDQVM